MHPRRQPLGLEGVLLRIEDAERVVHLVVVEEHLGHLVDVLGLAPLEALGVTSGTSIELATETGHEQHGAELR